MRYRREIEKQRGRQKERGIKIDNEFFISNRLQCRGGDRHTESDGERMKETKNERVRETEIQRDRD